MNEILNLARGVNWNYSTRNKELFINSANQLYNYVSHRGAKLLTIFKETSDLQAIGKAFSYFARFIADPNPNVNSVAAENAYYCLAKSVMSGNYYAAPELYNLVESDYELLIDKLVAARITNFKKTNPNTPIGFVYGFGNPFKSQDAQSDARTILPHVRFYIISQFYDIKSNKTRMPNDIIEYSQSKVEADLLAMSKKHDLDSWLKGGKEYFEQVYYEIEETLLKF
jgi:hypothetical protein